MEFIGGPPNSNDLRIFKRILEDSTEAREHLSRTALTKEEKLSMVTIDDPEWPPLPDYTKTRKGRSAEG